MFLGREDASITLDEALALLDWTLVQPEYRASLGCAITGEKALRQIECRLL
jgi:hypothetical protein